MAVISVVDALRVKVRGKCRSDDGPLPWADWISQPSKSYIEFQGCGPIEKSEIEWIDINAVEERRLGQRLPMKKIDHGEEIARMFAERSVRYIKSIDGLFRVGGLSGVRGACKE